jgi:hypothetical protein
LRVVVDIPGPIVEDFAAIPTEGHGAAMRYRRVLPHQWCILASHNGLNVPMRLEQIDKARYDRHYKLTFAAIVAVLLIVSLLVSTVLIHLVGNPDGGNFWLNLTGVVVAAFTVAALLRRYRTHPFLTEVAYVWDLKQTLNRIHRKQRQLKAAVEQGDHTAMVIMYFYLKGSRQLYELDDNTVTMDELVIAEQQLKAQMTEHGVGVTLEDFDPALLQRY